jgi:hypothetical protein
MDDGIALRSTAHPTPRFSWLTLLWWRIIRKDISKSALQTVEIEISDADFEMLKRGK